MLKLRKSARLLYVALLSISATLTLSSCAHQQIPDPPAGELYSIYIPGNKLLCSMTDTGADCPDLPMANADKYYALHPDMWRRLENYIDQLIALVKNASEMPSPLLSPGVRSKGVIVAPEDIQRIKDSLWHLRKTLEWKRKNQP